MTNGEILEKIVNIAIKNGYKLRYTQYLSLKDWEELAQKEYEHFIFDHNFAKAFFGEKVQLKMNLSHPLNKTFGELEFHMTWKYHLQQMVLADEPLKYLENFL